MPLLPPRFNFSNLVTTTLMSSLHNFNESKFIDRIRLEVIAGSGGNGCRSYHRDRMTVAGPPDGGDGGGGGDIYIRAVTGLSNFYYIKRRIIEGNNGGGGGRAEREGKKGGDIHFNVPIGTLVWELMYDRKLEFEKGEIRKKLSVLDPGKKDYMKRLLKDLDQEGKEILVARGGEGGQGNAKHRGNNIKMRGTAGQKKFVFLELKTLADIGLVGLPNVGKSTLLASISRSLPKIANYPFTTLNPMVGKVRFIDNFELTVADIPGIIKDAHQDKGLGLDFLRHIERTKVLVYLLDVSWGEEDLYSQFILLKNELTANNPEFSHREYLIVVNKCDANADSEGLFQKLKEKLGKDGEERSFLLSAKLGFGVGELVVEMRKRVEEGRRKEAEEEKRKEEEEERKEEKGVMDRLMKYA